MKYTPVIGLEVHVELKTQTKMFCGCSADYFGKNPNTYTCPVCLGLPGALPYPNKLAIEWCVKIALSLNCKIKEFSKFDRKNYFYPDLPKGYQISQYDLPFGHDGFIEVFKEKGSTDVKKIGITRVHMEEDTGKLTHAIVSNEKVSLIDFNRSGVPLVEIVTEPDFENEHQVIQYLQKLQKIVRYLGVSNADMEKGDMRLEPNISLSKPNTKGLPNYKVEVKNINSFRFVDRAIQFEVKRQTALLDKNQTPKQETRGWNEVKNETVSQRSKEEAHDYRYFPEPDIPPIEFTEDEITSLKSSIPELPDEKFKRFEQKYNLTSYDSEILTREKGLADYFEEVVKVGKKYQVLPKQIANEIINTKVNTEEIFPAKLVEIILENKKTETVDESELFSVVTSVLTENAKAVEEYKNGKENVLQFLIGQTMRKLGKKVDLNAVKSAILEKLK